MLAWILRLLAEATLIYLLLQVALVVGLCWGRWGKRHYYKAQERWYFWGGPPIDLAFWRKLIVDHEIKAVAFDYDRLLAERGRYVFYPRILELMIFLRDLGMVVYIVTNSRHNCVEQAVKAVNTEEWEVRIVRPERPECTGWRRFFRWLIYYFCKKPWGGFWDPAFARMRADGFKPGDVAVADDKSENMLDPLGRGAVVVAAHPGPGRDTLGDWFGALRWRERVLLFLMGVYHEWRNAPKS